MWPISLQFDSELDQYITYNFHRPASRKELVDIVAGRDPNEVRVVNLVGEPGSGRRYLCRSAAHECAQNGEPVAYVPLTFDDYEPGRTSFEDFATRRIERLIPDTTHPLRQRLDELKLKLTAKLKVGPMSPFDLVSFELGAELARQGAALEVPKDEIRLRPRDLLSMLLREASRDRRLFLHLIDPYPLDQIFWEWLLNETRTNKQIFLAYSTEPGHDLPFEIPYDDLRIKLIGLEPLKLRELRHAIDGSFGPNRFPVVLYDNLARYSHGHPGLLAGKLFTLVRDGLITLGADGAWIVSDPSMESKEWVDAFERQFDDILDRLGDGLDAENAKDLRRFGQVGALCGERIPASSIVRFLEITDLQERDDFLELLDQRLVGESSPRLWDDRGYKQKSFPDDELVFAQRNPIIRWAVMRRMSDRDRTKLATDFLKFLRSDLPVSSRGIARLHLEVARFAGSHREVDEYLAILNVWVSLDQADWLEETLRRRIENGEVDAEALYHVCVEMYRILPIYTSQAALSALYSAREGVPFTLVPFVSFHLGDGLQNWREYDALEKVCQRGLTSCPDTQPRLRSNLHYLLGKSLRGRSRHEEAVVEFDNAIADLPGDGRQGAFLACVLVSKAVSLAHLRRHLEVVDIVLEAEKAVAATKEVSLNLAYAHSHLGDVYYSLDNFDGAEFHYREALEVLAALVGRGTGLYARVAVDYATLLRKIGRNEEAERIFREAIPILDGFYGPEVPMVSEAQESFAELLSEMGREDEAAEYRARAKMFRGQASKSGAD